MGVNQKMEKIVVLTSGGDGSGMNPYIKALAKLCKKNNIQLFGSMYGYQGLIKDEIVELDYDSMRQIQNMGGTILKSSRCKEFQTEKGFQIAVENIKKHNFDCVVVVGGNGSMRGARDLMNAGVNVIGVPATIDNDFGYTDLALGYDTACENAVDYITKIKQSMYAFDRGFIAEVMGRHCGDIAFKTAIITNADLCITENLSFEELLDITNKKIESGVKSPLYVVQENLLDIQKLGEYLQDKTKKEFRFVKIGYIQRGGEPSNIDKMFAIELAVSTIENAQNNIFGVALGKKNDKMVSVELEEAVSEKKESSNLSKIYKSYSF